MPTPIDLRKKPASVQVHVTDGAGIDISWGDGHKSHYDFVYLREECPCAICDDERRKKDRFAHSGASANSALPLFKPRPSARAAKAVGNYALQIDFSDGHTTGIYSYDYLRVICPCEECAAAFRVVPDWRS